MQSGKRLSLEEIQAFLEASDGLEFKGRAQSTRLLGLYLRGEEMKPKPYRLHRFRHRYQREDIELLAEVDEAHETLSGPATQKILQRAYYDFQELRYERLARLSVAQLYRLAAKPDLPTTASGVSTDSAHTGVHWRAAASGTKRPARLFASGHRAPRGSG